MINIKFLHTNRHKALVRVLCFLVILVCLDSFFSFATEPERVFTPQIPKADRMQKNKVFLEYADSLRMDEKESKDYQKLIGNVRFRKEGMIMYCDTAYFYDKTNSLDAFGNVRMIQGDTLSVTSDVMYYDGIAEKAQLQYNVVMRNNDVTLETEFLDYDLVENVGYYASSGTIKDSENTLTSIYGQYEPDTKNAEFLHNVKLTNDRFVLSTDTLEYNTTTHIADLVSKTNIVTSDTTIIYSQRGWYNTDTEFATLYDRSLIVSKDNMKLTGDTLLYDKIRGYGEAFGNMVLNDSVHSTILEGDYGFHDDVNKISFATKRARVLEYSKGDTLYAHSDTIRTYLDEDSTRILSAYHKVRFYRIDLQGICDSLSFTSRDSILNMYRHPVIWNENKQIFGNMIKVHLNDSTVDWAELPEFGFVADFLGEKYYNQLSGKKMFAEFERGELRQLDVNGNVQSILFPAEKDSTYNKFVTTESSFLTIMFKQRDIEKLTMWPEVTGKAIPLYLSKKSELYLPKFAWYGEFRPKDKNDIFVIPEGMAQLFTDESLESRPSRKSKSGVDNINNNSVEKKDNE